MAHGQGDLWAQAQGSAVNVVVLEGCNSASPQQQCGGREVRQGTLLSSGGGTLKLERSGEPKLVLFSLRHLGGAAQGLVHGHTEQCLPLPVLGTGQSPADRHTESLTLTQLHAARDSHTSLPARAAPCALGVT